MISRTAAEKGTKGSHWVVPGGDGLVNFGKALDLGCEFESLRLEAAARVIPDKLPQTGDELWRFTRPQQFQVDDPTQTCGCEISLAPWGDISARSGMCGLGLLKGREAVAAELDLFKYLAGKGQDDISAQVPVNLQTALTASIHLLVVEKNARISKPLLLSQIPLERSCAQAVPWIVVLLQPGAQLTLVEDLNFDFDGLFYPRLEIVARDNSVFDFVSMQRLNSKASYLGRHRFHLERDVSARVLHAFLGSRVSRLDLECRLLGQGASIDLRSVYVADGKGHIDFHPTQEHISPHCQSRLLSKGVVRDRARAVYYGYIRVAEGAQKTDAYQTNRNLLFSSEARADSIPNLEIKANDVRCSHGSSVGQVGAEELFYLMSRGLGREAAEKLLVEGFFEEVLAGYLNPEICAAAGAAVVERLKHGSGSSRIE